jgi:hypothetical protein
VADRGAPGTRVAPPEPTDIVRPLGRRGIRKGMIDMSEEAEKARQALQESMDLREQGHSDD